MTVEFSELGLGDKVTEAVAAAGYTKPTDIQAQAIPHVLEKKDLIGIAQTGTGKTASFVLPMLSLLEKGRARARMPRTLILEPTRELAAQVHENFEKYGKNHRLTVALLIGGVSFEDQNKKLDRGADVLIATPGRMLDHFERGRLLLTGVDILVIDEADRMLDMGFIPDIERICSLLPPRRQTLFFSATMPPEIQKLTQRFLRDPVKVEVARQNSTADTIEQVLLKVGKTPAEKRAALRDQIRAAKDLKNAIIFCNRKRDVATVARSLERHGFDAGALHGDMDQKSRTETLDRFRSGSLAILVASDVAARGLDIPAVSHVFNFDVPTHAEDYVHRIGRTGRAGRSGTAITLIAPGETKYVDAITKLIQRDIAWADAPAAASPSAPAGEEAPEGGRKRGRRTRNRDEKPAAEKPQPKKAAEQAGRPHREHPRRANNDDGPASFKSEGHIPAFLLRPAGKRA
ncbi:DEAD/DEAH box helicase [Pelagibacterium halotolerans]|uniref:DEAD-box ATP-dependent RNA helicase RhpA n=1 Tax=Pelagibacterium halotolerans (strain DSM 22347 / JCM 15775 / CGMCC 1.7692 / B2) TaxID=1082931 RepID=G4RAJ4_PELHB|nr:DEAD/DEAH box helicase [Pelagibacterium halotolerans]AEQ51544.1 ATP-dependent RNA helicase [Pelagibacterium halotolerans B2]QJR18622.1 DEAD/DEAH box helicase [Pelagibacterium halotolerans]SEA16482.1 Superfamily II DNA and RNA helicase [Pelagibacterium halotolerans]